MGSVQRLLDREKSILVIIDIQESYRGKTFREEQFLTSVRRLLQSAERIGIPMLVTEQYPRGLGPTVPEVRSLLPAETQVFEKRSLSCWRAAHFPDALRESGRTQVVVCGLETHACVNQTVHDLLARGFQVHVPVDAVTARFPLDHRVGLRKMFQSGAVPATVEMVAFEWLRTADAPEFKAVQQLFK